MVVHRGTGRACTRGARSRLLIVAVGFVALFACLLLVGAIAREVSEHQANALDALLTPLLHGPSNPTLDAVVGGLTDAGSTVVVIPLLVVALALHAGRGPQEDRRKEDDVSS